MYTDRSHLPLHLHPSDDWRYFLGRAPEVYAEKGVLKRTEADCYAMDAETHRAPIARVTYHALGWVAAVTAQGYEFMARHAAEFQEDMERSKAAHNALATEPEDLE